MQVPPLEEKPEVFCVRTDDDGVNLEINLCLNEQCTARTHISGKAFNEFLNKQPTTRDEVVAQAKAQMKLNKMNSATRSDNLSAKGTMKEPGDSRASPEKLEEKPSSIKKKIPCKFFQMGKCTNPNCTFSHENPPDDASAVETRSKDDKSMLDFCRFANTPPKGCTNPKCHRFHPTKRCQNIDKPGGCKYGSKCRFAHFKLEESN